MSNNTVSEILSTMKLKGIDLKREIIPFNILHIMYNEISRKENIQSIILAGLLNNNENHDFGYSLVELFFEMIGVNFPKDGVGVKNYFVETERGVNGRRIDIFISWTVYEQKYAVIIENKLNGAISQKNQLNDYYNGILNEGYQVEKIVYIPFSSKTNKASHTDTTQEVLNKTINFDVTKIIEWLGKSIDKLSDSKNRNTLIQYKELFKCLQIDKLKFMKAIEIQKTLTSEQIKEVESLARIVNDLEWSKAKFNLIDETLKKEFNDKIEISYRRTGERDYAQYFFRPYKYWIELWNYEKIHLYLCCYESEEVKLIDINGNQYTYSDRTFGYLYYCNEQNHTYDNYKKEDMDKLLETMIGILKELEKYK